MWKTGTDPAAARRSGAISKIRIEWSENAGEPRNATFKRM
jgi:hypothetical protein